MTTNDAPDGVPPMPATEARPAPRTYPLGWSDEPDGSTEPGRLPTLEEFRQIKIARCRLKLVAERCKALAADVFAAFGAAARPVLESKGLRVSDDGTITSAEEEEVDLDWRCIVWEMHRVHGPKLRLPCDTRIDADGCVTVLPHTHEAGHACLPGHA
jgi:hypothetical protein